MVKKIALLVLFSSAFFCKAQMIMNIVLVPASPDDNVILRLTQDSVVRHARHHLLRMITTHWPLRYQLQQVRVISVHRSSSWYFPILLTEILRFNLIMQPMLHTIILCEMKSGNLSRAVNCKGNYNSN
jgi:hypothetical protein